MSISASCQWSRSSALSISSKKRSFVMRRTNHRSPKTLMRTRELLPVLIIAVATAATNAAEYRRSSANDIATIDAKLQPGDAVVLANGTWKDQAIVLSGKGTAGKPII